MRLKHWDTKTKSVVFTDICSNECVGKGYCCLPWGHDGDHETLPGVLGVFKWSALPEWRCRRSVQYYFVGLGDWWPCGLAHGHDGFCSPHFPKPDLSAGWTAS